MKKTSVFLLLSIILVSLCSCSYKTRSRNIIILIDYSGSIYPEKFNQYKQDIIRNIFLNLGVHDEIALYPVDLASTYENSLIFSEKLHAKEKEFGSPDDGVYVADSINARKTAYLRTRIPMLEQALQTNYVYRVKDKKYTHGTDLLGAFENLGNLQKSNLSASKSATEYIKKGLSLEHQNILIVFSDMINETPEYNFAKWKSENAPEVIRTLDEIAGKGRIKNDLHGCQVFIFGSTIYDDNKYLYLNIKNFWLEYFRKRGADLQDYQYNDMSKLTQFLTLEEE